MANPQPIIVDSLPLVAAMIDAFLSVQKLTLFVDCEGINLSRNGTVSIIQIFFQSTDTVYLVDTFVLGAAALNTPGSKKAMTLKDILEHEDAYKVFFDVRNDSDALHAHYGVRLQGVGDVQVMENASRANGNQTYVNGLAKCIANDAGLTPEEQTAFQENKTRGRRLFAPDQGGSYAVFERRPMLPEIVEYCVCDVVFMPRLVAVYQSRLKEDWKRKVRQAVLDRIAGSQAANYLPTGPHKAYGPWTEYAFYGA